jgi:hypothetical protein
VNAFDAAVTAAVVPPAAEVYIDRLKRERGL